MAKIKQTQDDGTVVEVDVVTPEEHAAKIDETNKQWETKLNEKETTLNDIAREKKELEDKISAAEVNGIKDDHPNFKILKDALAKKDADIESLRNDINKDKDQRTVEAMDSKIKIITKGDTELEKKVKLHLSTTLVGMKESTETERQAKIEAAYKLSADTSTEDPGMFDGGVGGGSKGHDFNDAGAGAGTEFTPRERALGAKLGITPEDYKKYGPRVSKR